MIKNINELIKKMRDDSRGNFNRDYEIIQDKYNAALKAAYDLDIGGNGKYSFLNGFVYALKYCGLITYEEDIEIMKNLENELSTIIEDKNNKYMEINKEV